MRIINLVLLFISNILLLVLLVSSIVEREKRASFISFAGLFFNSLLWLVFIRFDHLSPVKEINLLVVIGIFILAVISLIPFFPHIPNRDISQAEKYDERDNMFARNNLQFHPELAAMYYSAHPEKKEIDEKIRDKPELGEPGSAYYDHYGSPVMDAAFTYLARTRFAASGEKSKEKKTITNEKMIRAIRDIARLYGAVDVGFTELLPYHLYSRFGRHKEGWGEIIKNQHHSAIVFVVKMDLDMIKGAPALSAAIETSHQYVEAAKIAYIIAEYIRSFGYDARAHTDANYQVLCVPIAVDSGIGVLGRLGIFMHPVSGPCVRLSVVTTDLKLDDTKKKKDYRVEHFCRVCKKCADNCPSKSIPNDEEPSSRGFRHWSIDQEKCFSLWKTFGTDCAVCIRVCPYTKPDTPVHRLVRFYISRNSLNQYIALFFDDFLYGRKQAIPAENRKIFRTRRKPSA
ncbi:4Fe-4S dicluster domain-containing protein [Acidobacteriota bacterium]